MCGICGYMSKREISSVEFHAMNQTMFSRGPDDEGEECYPTADGQIVWLGHKRLSILDLSAKGHQPFHSQDNRVIVVFNGEIYNYPQLKKELKEFKFVSSCDTEIIIAAYQKWGKEFVYHIDGMFAIALYDNLSNELILVRDRIGKKTLYYSLYSGVFVFASALKAIMNAPGFRKEINKEVLPSYLLHTYISKEKTILKNVYRLLPGEMLVYKENKIFKEIYWSFLDEYKKAQCNIIEDYSVAKAEVEAALIDAVSRRMMSDVPLGVFLSSGYDSTTVAAIARKLTDRPLKSFCVGYSNSGYAEVKDAEKIAKHLNLDHSSWIITESEFQQAIEQIVDICDEPFAENAGILTLLVSQFAKKYITVALTGDGGDEIFCGYNRYDQVARYQKNEFVNSLIRPLAFPFVKKHVSLERRSALDPFAKKYRLQMMDLDRARIASRIIPSVKKSPLFDEGNVKLNDWQVSRMLLDGVNCLPDNNLARVDRMTMASSLEARSPLLDVNLIQVMFRVPQEFKYRNGCKKYILKDIAHDYIPREMLERPKKTFSPSLKPFVKGVLKADLLRVTSKEYLKKQDLFDPEFTSRWIRQCLSDDCYDSVKTTMPYQIVLSVYLFQRWFERHFDC